MNKAKEHAMKRASEIVATFIERDLQFILAHDRDGKKVLISSAGDADTIKRLFPEFTLALDGNRKRYVSLKLNYA